jgi:tetratricopeptide (TPR) repeat protein
LALAVAAGAQEGPPGPPDDDRMFFQLQVMRAIDEKVTLLIEQGKLQAASQELRRVQAIEVPREHPAFGMKARLIGRLALAHAELGAKVEALDVVSKLLAEVLPGSPAEAAAYLDAGVVYRRLGMAEEALKAFDRAIELSEKLAESGRRFPPGGPRGRPPRPPQ